MEAIFMDKSLFEECSVYLHPEAVEAIKGGEPYSTLLLTDQGTVVGAIAGRVADRELLIESLFIEKDSRGKGGGRLLFEALTEACGAFCSGIRVCFSAVNEDMETLPGFFEAMGFRERDGGFDRMFLADLRELERSPLAVRKGRGTPFSQVSPKVLRQLSAEAAENGWVVPRNGFFADSVDRELSMVQTDLDRIEAYAVVEHLSGYLCLSALQCNQKGIMKMEALLSAVWRRAAETEYRRRKLIIHTINEDSYRFVRFLLPEAKEISHTMEREIL